MPVVSRRRLDWPGWVLYTVLLGLVAEAILNYASTSPAGAWTLGLLIAALTLLTAGQCLYTVLPRVPPEIWIGVALWLWVGLQWFTHASVNLAATATGFHALTGYGLLLVSAWLIFSWYGRQAEVCFALLVFGLALAVFGLAQHLAAPLYIYGTHTPPDAVPFASFINRDDFAAFAECLIPVGLILGIWGKRDVRAGIASVAAAFLILAVLASGSRAGILLVCLELVVIALLSVGSSWRRLAWIAALVIATAGLAWYFSPLVLQRLAVALRAPTQDPSFHQRWLVDVDTWHMWRAHLWTGLGWGSFLSAFPQFQTYYSPFIMEAAHNEYLQLAAETGLIGLLPAVAWLGVFAWRGIQLWRNFIRHADRFDSQVLLGTWVGLAAFLLHCGADFLMHIPALAGVFFVFSAALASTYSRPKQNSRTPRLAVMRGVEQETQTPA